MMTAKDIDTTRRIEDWANEQIKLHKRECKDSGCIGRSKVWWITRHPKTHPDIANKTAVDYVLSRQCCEILELRLVKHRQVGGAVLDWLPGELELNRSRTVEEKAQLLGREFIPAELPESTDVSLRSTSESQEVVPESPRPKKTSGHTQRDLERMRNQALQVRDVETLDWVDSLTRRRD